MPSSSRSKKVLQIKEPDFGTYHHSTSGESKDIRKVVETMFDDGFSSLPFQRDQDLNILDVGCGLGFLSCISAEFYTKAQISGFDTFEHDSLKGSSIEKAKENAKILGLSDRIEFEKGDVFTYAPKKSFDIFVSNLVYHNFGRKRFGAYSRLASWARPGSFVLMGELFFSPKTDLARLSKEFKILKEIKPTESGFEIYRLLVMSRKRSKEKQE
jgi:2-polyprenyl-3-methyl-5-hydroxy-6-metoxy-1,4-benzoquinol methylase